MGSEFDAFQSGWPPTTSDGFRMSSTAAASPRGNRQVSDVGVAPHFQTAKVVSKNVLLFGKTDRDEIAGLDALWQQTPARGGWRCAPAVPR